MNKTIVFIPVLVVIATVAFAYLPASWSRGNANLDFKKADAVVIARVTGVNRKIHPLDQRAFVYVASVAVGNVLRGVVKTNDVLNIIIGGYRQSHVDEAEPTHISQCNSQNGFDLRINDVYLLALDRQGTNKLEQLWKPRSGHLSIHHIKSFSCDESLTNALGKELRHKFVLSGGQDERLDCNLKYIRCFHKNAVDVDEFIESYIVGTNCLYPDEN